MLYKYLLPYLKVSDKFKKVNGELMTTCVIAMIWDSYEPYWKSHLGEFCNKDALQNFTKITGNYLQWSSCFGKVASVGISCSYSDITLHKLDLKPFVGGYFGSCFLVLLLLVSTWFSWHNFIPILPHFEQNSFLLHFEQNIFLCWILC